MTLPTKAELLRQGLVAINQQHKKVITNTLQIADHFNKRPSEVNRRIASLAKKGLCRITPSYYLNLQGKEQKYYELNRDQFLLVVMGFTGGKADQFKADFIQLFNSQETELLQWREQARLTADSTKQANDQIYWLKTELNKAMPESRKGNLLFIHIQTPVTKAVTGSGNTKRADMTADQLNQIGQLEQKVNAKIEHLRLDGIAALEIRNDVLTMIKTAGKKNCPIFSCKVICV